MHGPGLRPLEATHGRRSAVLGIWAVALLALASCGASRPSLGAEEAPKEAVSPTSSTTAPTTPPTPIDLSVAATAIVPEIEVSVVPDALAPWWHFTNPVESGGPLVFLVLDQSVEGWLEVLLPVRPNGTTGWVRTSDVSLAAHQYRLEVRLQEFRLDLFDAGAQVFSAEVGVARDNAPTPGGVYYITELLQPPETDSPYGSYAYGLSGFSDVFETFAGGPGQLGIHGTNDPASIGTQVSSGCIRLRNEDIERLVELLPLGTPVTIIP